MIDWSLPRVGHDILQGNTISCGDNQALATGRIELEVWGK